MKTTILIKGIDPKIKQKFKTYCAANGTTMSAAIIKFMQKKGR